MRFLKPKRGMKNLFPGRARGCAVVSLVLVVLVGCLMQESAGTNTTGKFRWRLTNVSIPALHGAPDPNAPIINDPAMFGKARLTLYPTVDVNPGESVSWSI